MTVSQLLIIVLISSLSFIANGYVIGIDLGTSFSCVGIMKNGKVEIIPNSVGHRITPSIVSFTDQEILIGDEIYLHHNPFINNPQNTVYETKRMMGRKYDDQIQKYFSSLPFQVLNGSNSKPIIKVKYNDESHEYSSEQISSFILSSMKQTAETYIGQSATEAVITVPAYFDDAQRQATKDAAFDAGLNALRIINEPTAAAIAYGMDKKQPGSLILVYDLGGSTLDVSLLELDEGVFEVISTASDFHIGGKNFNDRVLEYFIKVFKRKTQRLYDGEPGIDISNNHRAKVRLRREIEKAKLALSSTIQVRVELEFSLGDGIDFSETLTRARLEELNNDLFRETLKSIEMVLKDANVSKKDVDEIILSGGSTRIPKIQQLVKDFFNGKEPHRGINPDEVVAYGAAVQADIIIDLYHRNPSHRYHYRPRGCMDCVELNRHSVDIGINNNYASITYSFEFENTGGQDSEIQYEMAIDSGSYISYFVGEIDGQIYKGITKEKVKAAKEYKQAKKDKKNAILVSQNHDANVFKIQSNIQKGSKAVLNVTVEQLLIRTFGFYELSLDISNIDNNFKSKSKVIPISINLTDSNDIEDIEIPFGSFDSTKDTKNIKGEITKQGGNALSYFIFRYKTNNKDNNQMIIDKKSNTFLHRFGYDDAQQKELPRRVVFILDKSGSMWGIWKQAQEAIIGAIGNLNEMDRFGIVLFDSNVYTKDIRAADKNNVNYMIEYMINMKPGSATNLYGGLEAAMALIVEEINQPDVLDDSEYVNQIIFVTDGVANVGVTDPNQILNNIYEVNGNLRTPISIFGIGIGPDSGNQWVDYLNYPLIRQISIQNGGFDKRIKESETKQDLERYYKILESPQLAYIDVDYKSDEYEIDKLTQNKFNTLYSGNDIVICGKLVNKGKDIDNGNIKAVISADQIIEKEFVVSDDDGNGDIDVERIWAYLSLKNYESLLLQRWDEVDGIMRRLINGNALNLALTFKLVTPWTSMIVVEEKKVGQVNINDPDEIYILDDLESVDDDHDGFDYGGGYETAGILLLDVTPLSLGIEEPGGIFRKLIEKNSVIPTKKSVELKGNELPQVDISESNNGIPGVVIRICQGERVNVTDNIILAEYILNGKYDNTIDIEVVFEIDANGILKVQTTDDINGKYEVSISADKGRPSQEDIDDMLRAAEFFAEEDARMAEIVQVKNVLESTAYNLKNQLDDEEKLGGKLSDEDKETLYEAANHVIDWLDDNHDADRDDYKEKQQEFDDIVKPSLKDYYQQNPGAYGGDDEDDDYYSGHEDL